MKRGPRRNKISNLCSSHESQTRFPPMRAKPIFRSPGAPLRMLHSVTTCLGHFLYLGAIKAFHASVPLACYWEEINYLPPSPSKENESNEVKVLLCP